MIDFIFTYSEGYRKWIFIKVTVLLVKKTPIINCIRTLLNNLIITNIND